MKIDRHSRQIAKKYFRACVDSDGALDERSLLELVHLIVSEKPRNYLRILERLQQLVRLAQEERSVLVESATPLSDEGASIFQELEQRFGAASDTHYRTNPDLLGGLRIRRGSNIWDGSVRGRLDRLEQALS